MHTITELTYYPIKSFRGIPASSVRLYRMGVELDRRWMLVDADGRFITQREEPRLATFSLTRTTTHLTITAPGGDSTSVPLEPESRSLIPVTVWNSRLDAFTSAPGTDTFFSDALGTRVRLVRIPEAAVRSVDPRYGTPGDHVSFADAYPVLVAGTASLEELNRRLNEPVPMSRFRPNIVVATSEPFEEDTWTSMAAGDVLIRLVKPSDRCVITTTDQTTGERFEEPLRTLATFRKRGNAVYFAMNGIPDAEGTLSVGMTVDPAR